MGFGFDQVKNDTPQKVKNVRDTLIYFLMGCLAFANLFAPKLHITGEDYAMYIGFSMLAIKTVAKLFGVSEDEAVKNVVEAVEQVKKVENEDK